MRISDWSSDVCSSDLERKDRVDDALHATRAAVEEGIVPGGGTALLYATKALEGLTGENEDQTRGIDLIRRALQSQVCQIAVNAGFDGAVCAVKMFYTSDADFGFNVAHDTYRSAARREGSERVRTWRARWLSYRR